MTSSSDDVIPEILKLYDETDNLETHDISHSTNASESLDSQESNSDTPTNVVHQVQLLPEDCDIECIQRLKAHLSLLIEKDEYIMGYERAFATLFGNDYDNLSVMIIMYLNQLQKQPYLKDSLQRELAATLNCLNVILQTFIMSNYTRDYYYDSRLTLKCFAKHTGMEVNTFRETLILLLEDVKKFIDDESQHDFRNDECTNATPDKSDRCIEVLSKPPVSKEDTCVSIDAMRANLDSISSSAMFEFLSKSTDSIPAANQTIFPQSPVCDSEHTDCLSPTYDSDQLNQTDSDTSSNSTYLSCELGGDIRELK